jgi:hypothetical protein
MVRRVIPRTLAVLLLASLVITGASGLPLADAAQPAPGCDDPGAMPADDLNSAAVGLTQCELDALYGPGVAVQDGNHYQRDGYVLIAQGWGDVVVEVDPDGPFAEPQEARTLAGALLPQDAILVGLWALGSRGASGPTLQDAEEWISGSLAARYRLLGQARSGSILVLYDYSGTPFDPGLVSRIELRSAQLPQVTATPVGG